MITTAEDTLLTAARAAVSVGDLSCLPPLLDHLEETGHPLEDRLRDVLEQFWSFVGNSVGIAWRQKVRREGKGDPTLLRGFLRGDLDYLAAEAASLLLDRFSRRRPELDARNLSLLALHYPDELKEAGLL